MSDAAHTIAAIFRIELPRLVVRLARVVRDVGRAEEFAHDAMVIERWGEEGRWRPLRARTVAVLQARTAIE